MGEPAQLTARKRVSVMDASISFLSNSGSTDRGAGHLAGMMREGPERMQRLQSALTQTLETPADPEAWVGGHTAEAAGGRLAQHGWGSGAVCRLFVLVPPLVPSGCLRP